MVSKLNFQKIEPFSVHRLKSNFIVVQPKALSVVERNLNVVEVVRNIGGC